MVQIPSLEAHALEGGADAEHSVGLAPGLGEAGDLGGTSMLLSPACRTLFTLSRDDDIAVHTEGSQRGPRRTEVGNGAKGIRV